MISSARLTLFVKRLALALALSVGSAPSVSLTSGRNVEASAQRVESVLQQIGRSRARLASLTTENGLALIEEESTNLREAFLRSLSGEKGSCEGDCEGREAPGSDVVGSKPNNGDQNRERKQKKQERDSDKSSVLHDRVDEEKDVLMRVVIRESFHRDGPSKKAHSTPLVCGNKGERVRTPPIKQKQNARREDDESEEEEREAFAGASAVTDDSDSDDEQLPLAVWKELSTAMSIRTGNGVELNSSLVCSSFRCLLRIFPTLAESGSAFEETRTVRLGV